MKTSVLLFLAGLLACAEQPPKPLTNSTALPAATPAPTVEAVGRPWPKCAPPLARASDASAWVPDSIVPAGNDSVGGIEWPRPDRIYFRGGDCFDTGLYGVEYVDALPVDSEALYVVMWASTCTECEETVKGIWVRPPTGPVPEHGPESVRGNFSPPGRLYGVKRPEGLWFPDSLAQSNRAFMGACLPDGSLSFVVVRHETDENPPTTTVRIGRLRKSGIETESGDSTLVSIQFLEQAVRNGACREIEGRDQQMGRA